MIYKLLFFYHKHLKYSCNKPSSEVLAIVGGVWVKKSSRLREMPSTLGTAVIVAGGLLRKIEMAGVLTAD